MTQNEESSPRKRGCRANIFTSTSSQNNSSSSSIPSTPSAIASPTHTSTSPLPNSFRSEISPLLPLGRNNNINDVSIIKGNDRNYRSVIGS
jgi:hypothetical protein